MFANTWGMQNDSMEKTITKRNFLKIINKAHLKTKKCNPYDRIRRKLFTAIRNQNFQELKELQEYKLNLYDLNLALNFSVIYHSHSNAEVVKWLLEKGANPEQKDLLGHTLLINAFKRGFFKIVDVLLEYGANPDAQNILGDTLMINAFNNRNLELMEILLQHGAKKDMAELLVTAIKNNDSDIVKLLLRYGTTINREYQKGITTMMIMKQ